MLRAQGHLIASIVLARLSPAKDVLRSTMSQYVVKPWDVDLNLHLNHARYATYFSRAQAEHFMRTRYIGALYVHGWVTVVASTALVHVRAVPPLRPFSIETRITGCDEKYVYCEQTMSARGEVVATNVQRMIVLDRRGRKVEPGPALTRVLGDAELPPRPRYAAAMRTMTEVLRG